MGRFRYVKAVLDVVSTVVVSVAAAVLIWKLVFAPSSAPPEPGVQAVKETIQASRVTNAQGSGPVAIVEFSDFECPFCGAHARGTFPGIKSKLIDSGQAKYVAMHFPLEQIHPRALKAAEAAECAGRQGRFWEMHERLFSDVKALSPVELSNHAKAIGLEQARFERCLNDSETVKKVRADQAEGMRLGVKGTPAFLLGTVRDDGGIDLVKRISGAASLDVFEAEVAELSSRQSRGR
jgi:protein-disulfide isomerase